MGSIAVIILNYVTWQETLKEVDAVRRVLKDRSCEIIVVDNCSPNESAAELAQAAEGSFTFLQAERNGGYAAGNNIGLRYAAEKGHTYGWVLNNDIEFSDPQVLEKMLEIFERDDAIAVVNPDVYSPDGYLFNRDALKPSVWDMTFGMFAYKKRGRAEQQDRNGWLYVYRPQGCCMLLDIPSTVAMASAPNATCESPSPIKEYLLSTKVTPSNAEQSEISIPTTKAYLMNGKEK